MKTIGIIVLVIGLLLTIFTAVTFITKEKVVDIGALEVSKEEPKSVNWSPLIGIAVMAVGGLIIALDKKRV